MAKSEYLIVIDKFSSSTTCSNPFNHSRCNNHPNIGEGGGGSVLYDHLQTPRIFAFIMNKIFIRALKLMRKVAMDTILIFKLCHTNCVFQIL